jgi:hypothetical protein
MIIVMFYLIYSIIAKTDIAGGFLAGLAIVDMFNMFLLIFVHNMLLQKATDSKIEVLTSVDRLKKNLKVKR